MAREVIVWIMVLWLDGSGKAITVVPARWGSQEACVAAARHVPSILDRFCMPVPAGTGYALDLPPPNSHP